MTEETWGSEEEYEGGEVEMTEEEEMFENMLEIVTGEVFTEELSKFAEIHAKKFSISTDECTHEQFEIFREYRNLIEKIIDREMTAMVGAPFSCALVASKFNEKPDCAVFEEVADVLNSLNDFLAFKSEMLAHLMSKDKQDLVFQTLKVTSLNAKAIPLPTRSERIRNCN